MSADNLYVPNNGLKVIVTGPPRSGTSFLCGLIEKMGFHPGNNLSLKKPDIHNKYGYFEHLELNKISRKVFYNLGGDFKFKYPQLNPGWSKDFNVQKHDIQDIVASEQITLYKDNFLMLVPELFQSIYPNAKWVFIDRDIRNTYNSRFGEPVSYNDWVKINKLRFENWFSFDTSRIALHISYGDFFDNINSTLNKITSYLDIHLDSTAKNICRNFFKPNYSKPVL